MEIERGPVRELFPKTAPVLQVILTLRGAPWCPGTLGGAAEASGRATGERHGGSRGRRQAQETPQEAMGNDQLLARNLEATNWAALKNMYFTRVVSEFFTTAPFIIFEVCILLCI